MYTVSEDYDDESLGAADAWARAHTDLINAAFDAFLKDRQWLTPKALQRRLHQRGIRMDVLEAAEQMPRQLGTPWRGPDGDLAFRTRALRHCPEAVPYLDAAVQILRLAYRRYVSTEEQDNPPRIYYADLATEEMRVAAMLLGGEHYSVIHASRSTPESDWQAQVNESVAHELEGVRSVDDYLGCEAEHFRKHALSRTTLFASTAARAVGLVDQLLPAVPRPESSAPALEADPQLPQEEHTAPSPQAEEELLARQLLQRLESAEPLSQILPAARRLTTLVDDHVRRQWLDWEINGYSRGPRACIRQGAYRIWEPLHVMQDPVKTAAAMAAAPEPGPLPTDVPSILTTAPMAVLEATSKTEPLKPGQTEAQYQMHLTALINDQQRAVLIVRVRQAVHDFASEVLQQLVGQRARIALFGPDAVTVFSAGGNSLDRLELAAENLGRPGREASACLDARSALERMGLQLYAGDGQPYISPVDGKKYMPETSESHRLHAVVDHLWSRVDDEDQREALKEAHQRIQRVRRLASRAKTQPIPFADAKRVVEDAYRVAHALCFAGGFPPTSA